MKCHFLVDYIVLNEHFPQKHLTFKSFHRYLPFISQFRCILFDVNNSCCNFSFDFLSLVANWQHPVTFSELEYSSHDCSPKKALIEIVAPEDVKAILNQFDHFHDESPHGSDESKWWPDCWSKTRNKCQNADQNWNERNSNGETPKISPLLFFVRDHAHHWHLNHNSDVSVDIQSFRWIGLVE